MTTTKGKLPSNFLWGFATAAYQIEGSWNEDGRLPSVWDTYAHTPAKIIDGSNGDIACDSYHRYKEDIALLKSYGVNAYRFSISWSRMIPKGGREDETNEKGIGFYSDLIDELLRNDITPFVTLHHWDLPQELYERYRGFLTPSELVPDFTRFARLCFERFGDRVKNWLTFNEPWVICALGHAGTGPEGSFAPGRSSNRDLSSEGNSDTEPWIAGHTLLLAHASAVQVYRADFAEKQGGHIGITLNGDWAVAYNPEDPLDHAAAQHKLEFSLGWFADPIWHGDYPASMRELLGDRLPTFTEAEKAMLKGSGDFFGFNHYTTNYVKHRKGPPEHGNFNGNVELTFTSKDGVDLGPETGLAFMRPVPWGYRALLNWIWKRYGAPIYCTENGMCAKDEGSLPLAEALNDTPRVEYYKGYLNAMLEAVVEDGVDVQSYFGWSLMDNWEWCSGYGPRFGVTYVDYEDGCKRYPKESSRFVRGWFEKNIAE
ncbi:hypothetical protein YB2330_006366 [Saitoella coloradoensis]